MTEKQVEKVKIREVMMREVGIKRWREAKEEKKQRVALTEQNMELQVGLAMVWKVTAALAVEVSCSAV